MSVCLKTGLRHKSCNHFQRFTRGAKPNMNSEIAKNRHFRPIKNAPRSLTDMRKLFVIIYLVGLWTLMDRFSQNRCCNTFLNKYKSYQKSGFLERLVFAFLWALHGQIISVVKNSNRMCRSDNNDTKRRDNAQTTGKDDYYIFIGTLCVVWIVKFGLLLRILAKKDQNGTFARYIRQSLTFYRLFS
jgi:hypothetical protein